VASKFQPTQPLDPGRGCHAGAMAPLDENLQRLEASGSAMANDLGNGSPVISSRDEPQNIEQGMSNGEVMVAHELFHQTLAPLLPS